jgi:hypothetical protein
MANAENTLSELKKFFSENGQTMTIAEFKAEWDQLSDEEKIWFKQQPLK